MIKVYFDKNVLSHILTSQRRGTEAHGVTKSDLDDLLEAIVEGKILCLLGGMHLQEAAYALKAKSPGVAKDELMLIRRLMYTEEIIKFPEDLLMDDLRSYSQGGGPISPMMGNSIDLENLFSDSGDIVERKKILDETTDYNIEFLDHNIIANISYKSALLAEFKGIRPSFEDFYDKKILQEIAYIIDMAEQANRQEGLAEECKKRGLDGLLQFKSIAMAAGASLSYLYAYVFNEISGNKKDRRGEASDLIHALLSSAADIFVTHDKDFGFWISRVPNTQVEVLDHVHKLIARLKD
jgi:hypothetical protein